MTFLMYSTREVMRSGTFITQCVISMIINFGINFGIEWAVVSKWGKLSHGNFYRLPMWRPQDSQINSSVALDLMLTVFFLSFFGMLLGSNGVVQEVKKGKCKPIDTTVTQKGWWRYTPVRVDGLCARSFANAVYFSVLIGGPMLLIFWACMAAAGKDHVGGEEYTAFKGVFAFFIDMPVFTIIFFSAADSRNFEVVEYTQLEEDEEGKSNKIPLVGQDSHV